MNSAAIETTGVRRAGYPKLNVGEGKGAAFPFVLLSCHSVKAANLGGGEGGRKKLGEPEIIIRSSSEKEIK